jgi:hypothetical protein
MTYYNPEQTNIHERIQQGFLSDTREGKLQKFFAAYDHWNPDVDDGSDLQAIEHELGITPEEWKRYRDDWEIAF